MLKTADTLVAAGYNVRVVSTKFIDWAAEADLDLRRTRSWAWHAVDYRKRYAPFIYWKSGLRFHSTRRLFRVLDPDWAPLSIVARAYGRVFPEMLKVAISEPADLFYGGTSAGLAVAACAARHFGVQYALDLEDFHEGELEDHSESRLPRDLIVSIQRRVLPGAAFLTAGSQAIAMQYKRLYGFPVLPMHNTFSLPKQTPNPEICSQGALRLYWFSQTIGPGRGLEDILMAAGNVDISVELHLRGRALPDYIEALRRLADKTAPKLSIYVHAPAPPDQMVELSRPYDIGLALEDERILNHALCLSNKVFTYMLAGLAIIMTNTPGQRQLAQDLGDGAVQYTPGDTRTLADGLLKWYKNRDELRRARLISWATAAGRWHWEHPCESGAMIAAVEKALCRP